MFYIQKKYLIFLTVKIHPMLIHPQPEQTLQLEGAVYMTWESLHSSLFKPLQNLEKTLARHCSNAIISACPAMR